MQHNDNAGFADKQAWSLNQWLDYLSSLHHKDIDMGLSRIRQVYQHLCIDFSSATVVTVAGTNGKGSTCAVLEQAGLESGKRTGLYSSPHIVNYTEVVRINGQALSEEAHCEGFLAVELARGDIPLTLFEFGTLASLYLLAVNQCQLVLLEVGLGGRDDAVNIVDPDIAVLTCVDLDHQKFLGDTREAIGEIKAGIFRQGIPVVIGDPEPPTSVVARAKALNTVSYWQGKEFGYQQRETSWRWQMGAVCFDPLPAPNLPTQNVSTALCVVHLLGLSLNDRQVQSVVARSALPGRFQRIGTEPEVVLDVAHNPQAVRHLCEKIRGIDYHRLHLVVAMLADKDIKGSLAPLKTFEASWYPAGLSVARGADVSLLESELVGQELVFRCDSAYDGYQMALQNAGNKDLVVIFGSFYTVAQILEQLG